ncbi:MAG: 5-formyltetrahydrofolate cyclo-ligase [Bacteroidales bacterium]
MNDIEELKKAIRQSIKARKKALSTEEALARSALIFEKVEQIPVFQAAQTLLAYWALPGEVQTQDFILKWYQQKTILLPVMNGEELLLRPFTGLQQMQVSNPLGIAEPTGENFTQLEHIDLVIVPGVAFDHQNNRLGRGKAYYDRLLSRMKTFRLGVCFQFQIFDQIPVSSHDIPMDMVLTD